MAKLKNTSIGTMLVENVDGISPGSSGSISLGAVRFNTPQSLAVSEKTQARSNIGAAGADELASKAPLNSPALSGTPTTPTAATGTNTTQIASTAFVNTAVSGTLGDIESALETINGGGTIPLGGGYMLTVNMGGVPTVNQGFTVGTETFNIGHSIATYNDYQIKVVALPIPESVTINYDGYASESGSAYLNGVAVQGNTVTIPQDRNSVLVIPFVTCLSTDTLILMADGTERRLDSVKTGDNVVSTDPLNGQLSSDVVTEVHNGIVNALTVWEFDNGTKVKTIGRHRFWNVDLGEFMYLEAWNIGERAKCRDGGYARLVGHTRHEEVDYPYATLFTEKWNNYFANGLVAGNRRSVKGLY